MALVTVAVLWLGTGSPNSSTQGPTLFLNCLTSGEVGTALLSGLVQPSLQPLLLPQVS